jgi:hypothetical protein
MSNFVKKIIGIVILALSCSAPSWSALIVGKINGLDNTSTARPLSNVDVFIDGTAYITRGDSQGHYQFENVPHGLYSIWFYRQGFGASGALKKAYTDTVTIDITLMPDIPQGSCWEPIVRFSGEITDGENGNAIPQAFLRTKEHAGGCGIYVTWSKNDGMYDWKLSVDPESVTVWAPGYQSLRTTVQANPPDPGEINHERNFTLTPISKKEIIPETPSESSFLPDGSLLNSFALSKIGLKDIPEPHCILEVQVMDTFENKPIPYAYIWIHELKQGARTDQIGQFVVGPIEPGIYTVTPLKNDYIVPYGNRPRKIVVPTLKSTEDFTKTRLVLWMLQQP